MENSGGNTASLAEELENGRPVATISVSNEREEPGTQVAYDTGAEANPVRNTMKHQDDIVLEALIQMEGMRMSSKKALSILVAEDDHDDRDFVTQALADCAPNSSLRFVRDGQQLLDHLKDCTNAGGSSSFPDLILLDLNMPVKNGFEALREIKSNSQFGNIPVIVLTDCSQDTAINECYSSGANAYIIKPPSYTGYLEVMRTISYYWNTVSQLPSRLN